MALKVIDKASVNKAIVDYNDLKESIGDIAPQQMKVERF